MAPAGGHLRRGRQGDRHAGLPVQVPAPAGHGRRPARCQCAGMVVSRRDLGESGRARSSASEPGSRAQKSPEALPQSILSASKPCRELGKPGSALRHRLILAEARANRVRKQAHLRLGNTIGRAPPSRAGLKEPGSEHRLAQCQPTPRHPQVYLSISIFVLSWISILSS